MSDNLYFEPPSRLQLVDKLTHLLRFSNVFMMLAGPVGAGVSTVANQLHQQVAESDVCILPHELTAATNLDELLALLNQIIDEMLPGSESINTDALSDFQQKIAGLAALKRKILLSIDNADFLSDEALQSLLNLTQASQNEISILLGGSTKLVSRVSGQVVDPALTEIIHHEILSPFSRLETEEFIQLSFVRGSDFSTKQLTDIYLKSQGYPGLILQLTNEMIKSGKIVLNGKNNILPVPHIIGIAVLLTAIVTVSSWQYFSEDDLLEEGSFETQNAELAIITDEGVVTPEVIVNELEQHTDRAEQLQQEITSLSGRIEAQELLIDAVREESNIDSVEQADAAEQALTQQIAENDATLPTEVELLDQMTVSDQEKIDRVPTDLQIAEKLVEGQVVDTVIEPLEASVIEEAQLKVEQVEEQVPELADAVRAKVKEPLASVDTAVEKATVLKTQEAEKTSNSAEKSMALSFNDLTEQLQKNNAIQALQSTEPQALSQSVGSSITVTENSVVIADKSIKSSAVKAAKGNAIKPQVVNDKKESELGGSLDLANSQLDRQTLKSWPESGYTLQLLGTRSKAGIVSFFQTMPNAEKMRYFETVLKGKPWHVIVYGQYPNRTRASAAKGLLPAKLKALKPWVKSVKSVKNDINK